VQRESVLRRWPERAESRRSVRRSAASQPHRSPGTGVVWRLWSEPPDLVQTGSGTRMDLPALCPEQSGAKPAAPSSMGTQSYRSSLDVCEDRYDGWVSRASRLVGRVERRSGLLGQPTMPRCANGRSGSMDLGRKNFSRPSNAAVSRYRRLLTSSKRPRPRSGPLRQVPPALEAATHASHIHGLTRVPSRAASGTSSRSWMLAGGRSAVFRLAA
jgi:hypothetical protein